MLLLDVDFAICTDWRDAVRALLRQRNSESDGLGGNLQVNSVAKRVREGRAALVLPAFEYVKQAEGRDQEAFPRDRRVCVCGGTNFKSPPPSRAAILSFC
jgi:hypothetical protein